MVNSEYQILLLRDASQFLSLFHLEGQRLLAYDVDAVLKESLCYRVMYEVRRADGDKVDLAFLSLRHLFCGVVHAGLVNVVRLCALVVQFVNRGEAAAYQLCKGIQSQSLAVALTNKSLQVAAYHTISQFLYHNRILLFFYEKDDFKPFSHGAAHRIRPDIPYFRICRPL